MVTCDNRVLGTLSRPVRHGNHESSSQTLEERATLPNDTFDLMDEWGPEKVVCVCDRRTGMRGVLVLDNTARGMGKGGTRMSADLRVLEVARLANQAQRAVRRAAA